MAAENPAFLAPKEVGEPLNDATKELLAIRNMKESILEGMATPLEECFDELIWAGADDD